MTGFDRLLQRWRIRKVARYIGHGARVLDIGCGEGALFRSLGDRVAGGVGIDPAAVDGSGDRFALRRGNFPAAMRPGERFDVICLLAVLEHLDESAQRALARHCVEVLEPGGIVVATVPAPAVDRILAALRRLRLIHGIALEQHYGFDPALLPARFADGGLRLARHRRFQLGLNHLFVFEGAAP